MDCRLDAARPREAGRSHQIRVATLLLLVLLAISHAKAAQQLQFQFTNKVVVSPFADGTNWFLLSDLDYEIPDTDARVVVPAFFVTDFASIPRIFWSLLPTWGRYGPASVVHDYLYWDQQCTREQADAIFLLAMIDNDVPWWQRTVIYRAVRWGAAFAWSENADDRKNRLDRVILRNFIPSIGVKTTWDDLRKTIRDSGAPVESRPSSKPAPEYCAKAEQAWAARLAQLSR